MKSFKLSAKGLTIALATTFLVTPVAAGEHGEASHYLHDGRFSSTYNLDTLEWAGEKWAVRGTDETFIEVDGPQAPHPHTGRGEWVDGTHISKNGDLVLSNQGIDGGVEIISEQSMGYGTYTFEYSADFANYHPNTVLGIFTYDWADAVLPGHETKAGFTENDFIEISRWGEPTDTPVRAGATVYSDTTGTPTHLEHFNVPEGTQRLTTTAIWQPSSLQVITQDSTGKVMSNDITTRGLPESRTEQLHINLWTNSAQGGAETATGDTVTFHDFSFTPHSTTSYWYKIFAQIKDTIMAILDLRLEPDPASEGWLSSGRWRSSEGSSSTIALSSK
ncbi:hypothetical protein [Corynebacterium cystitidis]|uniref:hypothetical protein n=1 Tax=Corynebacterium cystitidis TaxID=35757 RepID=UPI00211E6862|nr:hypothetical protein [Corynebacterium cystitidis]